MNKRELAEFVRLDIDHPGWKVMSQADLMSTYWMYFSVRVALARMVAVFRRDLVKPIARSLDAIAAIVGKSQR